MSKILVDLENGKATRLKLGTRCNNNCVFCSLLDIKETYDKSLDEIRKELDQLKRKKYSKIVLPCNTGCRKDFFEILEYARELGFRITLETNGRMFYYEDFCERIARYVDRFVVYLNSANAKIHDEIANAEGSFDQAVQGIKNIRRISEEIQINTVITKHNLEYLSDVVKIAKKLNIRELRFIYPIVRERDDSIPEIHDAYSYIDEALEIAKKKSINVLTGEVAHNPFLLDDLNQDCDEPLLLVKRDKKTNHEINQQECAQQKSNLTTYPSRLYVELTRNCNMKCRMCYRSRIGNIGSELHMPLDLFKKIADELFPYAKFLDLRGFGESTILPNFLEYVDYALKFDSDIGILTNLSVKNDKMWEHLIKNNFWIGISIDGADKETYGKIRDGAYFEQVNNNIKLLVKFSKKYKKDINRLYFLVVVQKDNVGHLTEFIELAHKLGIKRIEFKPVRSTNETIWLCDIQDLTRKQVKKAVELAKKHKIELVLTGSFFDMKFEESLGYKPMEKCSRPWSHAYITYNGFIGPCNHQFNLFFGSLKYNKFAEIWNNNHFQAFRKTIFTQDRPERCQYCFENYFDNEWS